MKFFKAPAFQKAFEKTFPMWKDMEKEHSW